MQHTVRRVARRRARDGRAPGVSAQRHPSRPRGHASSSTGTVGVTRTDASGHAEEEAVPRERARRAGGPYRGRRPLDDTELTAAGLHCGGRAGHGGRADEVAITTLFASMKAS